MVNMLSLLASRGIIGAVADFFVKFSDLVLLVTVGFLFVVFFIAFAIGEGLGIHMGGKIE